VTGVQFLPFNTLYQLAAAHAADPSVLDRAVHFLTIPDLLNFRLTGRIACEYTNATTTQCIDARTRSWATSLLAEAGIPAHLFGQIVEPGTILGPVRGTDGWEGVPVIAPACHDTGSAVAAIDATDGTAFLSSGTWSLLGVEMPHPVMTPRSRELNFTNEGGVGGTTRLLKNVAGLWLLQSCRRDWSRDGAAWSYDDLAAAAAAAPDNGPVIDPDHPAFLAPAHMPTAIADYCRRTDQQVPESHGAMARTIFESLALKYRLVLEWLEDVSGTSIHTVRVIGGGAQNHFLNQLTADVTGRTVAAGPVEATALGNIAMQMLATGHAATLADARSMIERSFPSVICAPAYTDRWEAPYQRFRGFVELACA
jgi:rhamnulokinase